MKFCFLVQWILQYEHMYIVGDANLSTHPPTSFALLTGIVFLLLVGEAVLIQQELGAVNLIVQASYLSLLFPLLPCGHFGNILGCLQTSI